MTTFSETRNFYYNSDGNLNRAVFKNSLGIEKIFELVSNGYSKCISGDKITEFLWGEDKTFNKSKKTYSKVIRNGQTEEVYWKYNDINQCIEEFVKRY